MEGEVRAKGEVRAEGGARTLGAAWVAAGMLFLVQVVWTNLTGFGIGEFPLTYDTVALPRLVVAVVGTLLAWALVAWARRGPDEPLRVDIAWALLGALALWAVVSALASKQGPIVWLGQSERLEGVVTIALYALLFGLGLQLGAMSKAPRILGWAVVAGTGVLAVHGLLQAFGIDPTGYTLLNPGFGVRQAFASLDNPNFLAAHLVLAIPIAAACAVRSERSWQRAVAWVVVTAGVCALLTTGSQGAWLAATVQGAIAIALWLSRRRNADAPTRRTLARPLLVGVLVLVLGTAAIVAASLGRADLKETATARVMLAKIATDTAAERPLVGYGPDSYLAAFRRYHTTEYESLFGSWSTNNNAHFWVAQYLATLGIPGALLLASALILGLSRGRPRAGGSYESVITAAIWISLLGFTVQSMLNVVVIASSVPFWLLMGLVCSREAVQVRVPRFARSAAVAASIALALASLGAGVIALQADATYLRSRLVYNREAEGDAVALADRASRMNPLSVKYLRGAAQARAQLVLDNLGNSDAETAREQYYGASAAYERVLAASPHDYASLAWSAALDVAVGVRLNDPELRSAGVRAAVCAIALDSSAWQVQRLASGDTSEAAIQDALSVPALP
ncbi:MAG: hypothetical protein EG823_01675 [Actinobacteria bacterium]|nr:hypothetical protein [Actinomycetota bacterium]